MRILVSWLREFVDVTASPAELGTTLTKCGFELAGIDPVAGAPDDAVLDLEITANRPDCLSVLGMAREVATAYGLPLRAPSPRGLDDAAALPLRVTIEAPDLCPRYAAAMADVTIAPSPAWLVARLASAGVRAINNIVDITNYVLLEMGHPLHAFDHARLAGGELRIRRARPGEKVTTLDGQVRPLDDQMLVIADAAAAQAVAGVMGGALSEVSQRSRVIAIESAYFTPTSVRRTSKRLGLSTEASYRFERGADPEAPVVALARVCELIEQIGAGRVRRGFIDERPDTRRAVSIELRASRLARVLGHDVAPAEVGRILDGLGFSVSAPAASAGPASQPERWQVGVPSWRGDVTREIDLIEEVARHHGYDELPSTFPVLDRAPAVPDARLERDRAARRLALAAGFSEAITFTFIERAAAAPFADERELVALANPLSEKFVVLRPSLVPGLVDALAHNRRRERRDVALFETGSRFTRQAGETRGLAFAWMGAASTAHWSGTGRPVDFFDLKGAVELVCGGLGVSCHAEPASVLWLVPGRSATVVAGGGAQSARPVGVMGLLAPVVAASRGLPEADAVFVAEIDLDALAPLVDFRVHFDIDPLPRHPSVVRDISIVVDERLPAAVLRATILANAPTTLVEVAEFARYQGKGVPEGQVSLSFRLTFRALDRTLTDAEAHASTEAIVAALASAHGARLR